MMIGLRISWMIAVMALSPIKAQAIPYFANEYELKCQKCHTEVLPGLNKFGRQFMDHGFAFPGARPNRVFPVSTKIALAYTNNPEPGFPKEVVKGISFIMAGKTSPRTSYYASQRAINGARPGMLRETWFAYQLTPERAKRPAYVRAGLIVLPLPLDPEMFRETSKRYALFSQTVGAGTFHLYDPKVGVEMRAGYGDRGLSVHSAVLQKYDQGSGAPARGSDLMNYAQEAIGPATFSLYRYDGSRIDGGVINRFWRQGYGFNYLSSRLESLTVLQNGNDSSINGTGVGAVSNGGFTQLRYNFNRKMFGLVRYEGTSDPSGLTRDFIPLLGFRAANNASVTVEDVIERALRTPNTINVQYRVSY